MRLHAAPPENTGKAQEKKKEKKGQKKKKRRKKENIKPSQPLERETLSETKLHTSIKRYFFVAKEKSPKLKKLQK
jgi:hypothetical protein